MSCAGGSSGITTRRLFELLKIQGTLTNDDQGVAIEKFRKGEITAVAFVAGKPAPLFHGLDSKGRPAPSRRPARRGDRRRLCPDPVARPRAA